MDKREIQPEYPRLCRAGFRWAIRQHVTGQRVEIIDAVSKTLSSRQEEPVSVWPTPLPCSQVRKLNTMVRPPADSSASARMTDRQFASLTSRHLWRDVPPTFFT